MPEVSVVVELRVAVEPGVDPVVLERAIAEEGRRGSKELYRAALGVLDAQAVEETAGARQRIEERWVATVFGRMRIWRYRVKGNGGSFHPLDRALGLSQSEPSPALREAVCDLATRVPYRQVAELAARLTGEPFSHLSAWRVLQHEGARIRTEEGELVKAVFEMGEAPPEGGLAPEFVVVQADGTYIAAQGEEGDRFEVKTGVFYTGKARAGGRRHRRWRLLNKGCYATTGDADGFGVGLAARGFAWVGLHRARHVLCVHDGLDEYAEPSTTGSLGRSTRSITSTWPSGCGKRPEPTPSSSASSRPSPSPIRRPARASSGGPIGCAPTSPTTSPPTSRAWPPTCRGSTACPGTFVGGTTGCGWWARV